MKNKFDVIIADNKSKKDLSEEIIKAYKKVLIKNKQLQKDIWLIMPEIRKCFLLLVKFFQKKACNIFQVVV